MRQPAGLRGPAAAASPRQPLHTLNPLAMRHPASPLAAQSKVGIADARARFFFFMYRLIQLWIPVGPHVGQSWAPLGGGLLAEISS